MRICLLFDPWMLSFRGSLDLDGYRDDPRGLSGSEMAAVRLLEELAATHERVALFTKTERTEAWCTSDTTASYIAPWDARRGGPHIDCDEWDIAISINCPDPLRDVRAKFKVCYALLNDWTFAKAGFEQHVDLFASPSAPHLEQVMTNPAWRRVEVTPEHPNGKAQYEPDAAKWCVVPLGCDPERYQGAAKVPGRVVYCSSPDRGLHHLLQGWPAIKRAVPHAHLRIFYRLEPWLRGFDQTPFYPPIEPLRARALYVEEALRRMSGPEWNITVCDSVSRATIEREMAEAEVLAYPCDTTTWSEGFSCTVLEACAARACPVITDCDALGSIYGGARYVKRSTEDWQRYWREGVIECLRFEKERKAVNKWAEAFAKEHTWRHTAERLMEAIRERMG
jgi:glycosyltransferase involved in cell wall biosynthesis